MLRRPPAPLLALVGLTLACRPAQQEPPEETVDPAADRAAIEAVRDAEVAALEGGDLEGLLALATDDAVWMPEGAPVLSGKDAARGFLEDLLGQLSLEISHTTEELTVDGDLAVERWSVAWTQTPIEGGDAVSLDFKGIHVFERQPDGSWKITQDIWNSDSPPPAEGPP